MGIGAHLASLVQEMEVLDLDLARIFHGCLAQGLGTFALVESMIPSKTMNLREWVWCELTSKSKSEFCGDDVLS